MKNKVTMYDVYLNSDIYYVITRKCNITKCQLCDDKSIDKLDFPTKENILKQMMKNWQIIWRILIKK